MWYCNQHTGIFTRYLYRPCSCGILLRGLGPFNVLLDIAATLHGGFLALKRLLKSQV